MRFLWLQAEYLEPPGGCQEVSIVQVEILYSIQVGILNIIKPARILEKRIFGTQISMLGFLFFLENLKNYQAQLFYV